MNDLASLRIAELFANARARGASDLHFGGANRPALRLDGHLRVLDEPRIDDAAISGFLRSTLAPHEFQRFETCGAADGTVRSATLGTQRIHAYRHLSGIRVVVRFLATSVPTLESLALPPVVATFAARPTGLMLFTGPTGSGKTTALAALIDRINRTLERSILTIEDPIEYVHVCDRSIISQREIGRDVADYARALRDAMRADPNVLLVGEMRDRETMAATMTAAETGHLVFATLHTNDAPQTIDRIIDSFPSESQAQVRSQLSSVLHAVVSMRLIPWKREPGRRAAVEILIGTDAVRNLIREGKTHQIRNAIVTGRSAGMQTLESHLSELVMRGDIDLSEARAVSVYPADIRDFDRVAS